MALAAGGGVDEVTEDALLGSAHLPATITVRASAGLTTGLGASTLAQGAVLSARNIYLLFTTKGCLFKGDSWPMMQVGTALWSLMAGCSCPTKEGIKDFTKATEIKPLKTPSKKTLSTAMPKAVISSALVRIRKHLVGLVYLPKPVRRPILVIVVGVIFKG